MTGGKRLNDIAFLLQGFQFGSKPSGGGGGRVPSGVEGGDSDRITCDDHSGRGDAVVQQDEGEHAVQLVTQIDVVFLVLRATTTNTTRQLRHLALASPHPPVPLGTHQMHDHLTITPRDKRYIPTLQPIPQFLPVVDFSVDGAGEVFLAVCVD